MIQRISFCAVLALSISCSILSADVIELNTGQRIEGEVLKALRDFGDDQTVLLTIDPHQFLGIEVNPRAAAIADLVLWIGYLQWHFRTRGEDELREPIIRKFDNIECRDAIHLSPTCHRQRQSDVKPAGHERRRHINRPALILSTMGPITSVVATDDTARPV